MEKTCSNGHTFFKTSNCSVCPICEKERTPVADFLTLFPAPARRALENHGIITLERLAATSESELLSYHGFGPSSIDIVRRLVI
jgi:predicted RecB family nuclease